MTVKCAIYPFLATPAQTVLRDHVAEPVVVWTIQKAKVPPDLLAWPGVLGDENNRYFAVNPQSVTMGDKPDTYSAAYFEVDPPTSIGNL